MALVHFVGVVELAVVFRLPVLMVSCGMSIEIADAEVWTTACLDCGGVDRPICRRGGMTDSGGKQSDHDKQCHSVHRSTPFGESMRLSGAWRKWLPMRVMAISSSVCSGGYVCGTSASMLRARRKNSAASPRTTCRFTSGLMNRKPSWPTSGIALSVTIRRVFFLAERIFVVAIRNCDGNEFPVRYIA